MNDRRVVFIITHHELLIAYKTRSIRLTVRTPAFRAENKGSIPL